MGNNQTIEYIPYLSKSFEECLRKIGHSNVGAFRDVDWVTKYGCSRFWLRIPRRGYYYIGKTNYQDVDTAKINLSNKVIRQEILQGPNHIFDNYTNDELINAIETVGWENIDFIITKTVYIDGSSGLVSQLAQYPALESPLAAIIKQPIDEPNETNIMEDHKAIVEPEGQL